MTAATWGTFSPTRLYSRRRRGGMQWPRLSRKKIEILAAVREMGPNVFGLAMVKESKQRARQRALNSWRARWLPAFMLTWFAHNPIRRANIYTHLSLLEDFGYVVSEAEVSPVIPGLPRRTYTITSAGRVRLAYELGRMSERQQANRLFRMQVAE